MTACPTTPSPPATHFPIRRRSSATSGDQRITDDDVSLDTDQFRYHLRALQDAT